MTQQPGVFLSCNWKPVLQSKGGALPEGPHLPQVLLAPCVPTAPVSSWDPQLFVEEKLHCKGQAMPLRCSLVCKTVQGHLRPREGGTLAVCASPQTPAQIPAACASPKQRWGRSHLGLEQNELHEHAELITGPKQSVATAKRLLSYRVVKPIFLLTGFNYHVLETLYLCNHETLELQREVESCSGEETPLPRRGPDSSLAGICVVQSDWRDSLSRLRHVPDPFGSLCLQACCLLCPLLLCAARLPSCWWGAHSGPPESSLFLSVPSPAAQ